MPAFSQQHQAGASKPKTGSYFVRGPNERNPGVVSLKNWDNLARQCGLRPRFLQKQVQDVAARLQEQLQPTRKKFESLYGDYAALQRIEQIVTKQCQRTVNK
ncbi:MAG: hypothetical protein P8Y45_19195 [Exilibacterium sp.]